MCNFHSNISTFSYIDVKPEVRIFASLFKSKPFRKDTDSVHTSHETKFKKIYGNIQNVF
jgi:hypothetical protein